MTEAPAAIETASGTWQIDVMHPAPGRTCAYLLEDGGEGALIDCGGQNGIPLIRKAVADAGLKPEALRQIFVTHAHLDHAAAAGELMQIFPEAELRCHKDAARHLIRPGDKLLPAASKLFEPEFFKREYGEVIPADESRVRPLDEGDSANVGGRTLETLYTPGHAWHHVVFYERAAGVLYAGDAYGISLPPDNEDCRFAAPVMPPNQFNPEAMRASIEKIKDLAPQKAALTHFGVVDNSPALADIQIVALEEWTQTARDIHGKDADGFREAFSRCVGDWLDRRAGDGAARRYAHETHLTVNGYEHWLAGRP